MYANRYFWRTHAQQEIDYIEEQDNIIKAFELKWNPKKKIRFSKTFTTAYPNNKTYIVHPENYEDFLIKK